MMATTTEGNSKKTERDNNDSTGGVEGDNDRNKRQRTNSTLSDNEEDEINPSLSQIAATPDPVVSAIELNNDIAATNNVVNMNELPTPAELSQELCKIVSERYSRDESLRSLENLSNWASTEDTDFLKSFHTYGGIVKVVDFLNATMNDVNCKGSIRMECIENAADVILAVTYFSGENDDNEDIAKKIATTLLNCDGIDTLISASEEYTGGDDIPQLEGLSAVWNAIRNIICHVTTDSLMSQEQAIVIFGTGIDVISQLKSVCGPIASETLEHVLCTFYNIVSGNYVTKKYFQDKNILSKCLEVFKKNVAWNFRSSEGFIQKALDFFNICHIKHLLDDSSDYEKILPLLVIAIKKFPSNDEIRRNVVGILDEACSKANNKKIILRSGVMEPLGLLFASDEINNEDEKNKVRTLINKIIA